MTIMHSPERKTTSDEGEEGNDDTAMYSGTDELEVQRRYMCALHASQAQQ